MEKTLQALNGSITLLSEEVLIKVTSREATFPYSDVKKVDCRIGKGAEFGTLDITTFSNGNLRLRFKQEELAEFKEVQNFLKNPIALNKADASHTPDNIQKQKITNRSTMSMWFAFAMSMSAFGFGVLYRSLIGFYSRNLFIFSLFLIALSVLGVMIVIKKGVPQKTRIVIPFVFIALDLLFAGLAIQYLQSPPTSKLITDISTIANMDKKNIEIPYWTEEGRACVEITIETALNEKHYAELFSQDSAAICLLLAAEKKYADIQVLDIYGYAYAADSKGFKSKNRYAVFESTRERWYTVDWNNYYDNVILDFECINEIGSLQQNIYKE